MNCYLFHNSIFQLQLAVQEPLTLLIGQAIMPGNMELIKLLENLENVRTRILDQIFKNILKEITAWAKPQDEIRIRSCQSW